MSQGDGHKWPAGSDKKSILRARMSWEPWAFGGLHLSKKFFFEKKFFCEKKFFFEKKIFFEKVFLWTLPLPKKFSALVSGHQVNFICCFLQINICTFLASQDALEVMLFTYWLTDSLMVSWLDWCDSGEWWYLKKTWLMWLVSEDAF